FRRVLFRSRPAAHRNFEGVANDPGSLPDKVPRARPVRCSFEKLGGLLKDIDHLIDFFASIIKIEARSSGSWNSETPHERLITMMTTAHGQAVLIGEGGEVVRMCRVHHKTNRAGMFFGGAEDA